MYQTCPLDQKFSKSSRPTRVLFNQSLFYVFESFDGAYRKQISECRECMCVMESPVSPEGAQKQCGHHLSKNWRCEIVALHEKRGQPQIYNKTKRKRRMDKQN